MIRLSVLYPKTDGASFDHDYYRDSHVPLALKTWGLESAEIDKGIDGPYEAAVHFTFDSMEAFGDSAGMAANPVALKKAHDSKSKSREFIFSPPHLSTPLLCSEHPLCSQCTDMHSPRAMNPM